ncbi:sulfotransferase [Rhizobiales bacterium]|uniref:sulfotransferase family protein n=1 Tax=Hongsoonwoonella zoysiae TaxID=2821844 RepID=UPI001560D242|nr:sulfotransferase [Hongsoonwoonella zoysiae]NRG18315.1 sulfotransferase [Hongsoonwoonella zoysiae]
MKMKDIDFLIIGATKSATTWLQRSLQADPKVFMPDPELHFFSREYNRGEDWYLVRFEGRKRGQVTGEKSNSYLEDAQAAARISRSLPNAKLIVQLRNPVDRAYSDYCMLYRRGEVGRDIERYLDPANSQGMRFIEAGEYYNQLQIYYQMFSAEQILITFYEAINTESERQLETVRSFLDLEPGQSGRFLQSKVKDKTTPTLEPKLRRVLSPLKPLVAPMRGSLAFEKVRGVLASEIRYRPIPEHIRDSLVDYYSNDVEKLSRLLGRDLSGWLRNPSASTAA